MTTPAIVGAVYRSDHDAESYSVQQALEEVVAWFVADGFADEDIEDRVAEAIEHVREDD
jgi:uncharacterized membrane-anchored protein YjiN (DUF445 family)